MEATIVYRGYIIRDYTGIMKKKVGTTIWGSV